MVRNQTGSESPVELLVSREEARKKIEIQIAKGNAIKNSTINSLADLDRAVADHERWSDFNKELLKRLFSDKSIADEYSGGFSFGKLTRDFLGQLSNLKKAIDTDVNILRSILERLDLMSEPLSFVTPTHSSRAVERDSLTDFLSRKVMDTELPQDIAAVANSNEPLSVIMMDIDNFKKINDAYTSHQVGDAVIKEVANRVRFVVGAKGKIYRYGSGDEFLVSLQNYNTQEALALAERIRIEVQDAVMQGSIRVTMSLGIGTFPDHGRQSEEIIKAADKALYDSKDKGRNLVRYFNEPELVTVANREPERKRPKPGLLTEEQKKNMRESYFKGWAIRCPKDAAILKVTKNHPLGESVPRLLIHCGLCGMAEEI